MLGRTRLRSRTVHVCNINISVDCYLWKTLNVELSALGEFLPFFKRYECPNNYLNNLVASMSFLLCQGSGGLAFRFGQWASWAVHINLHGKGVLPIPAVSHIYCYDIKWLNFVELTPIWKVQKTNKSGFFLRKVFPT